MRKLRMLLLIILVLLVLIPTAVSASTTKLTTVNNIFTGFHSDIGACAWNTTTKVYGTFGTYTDEKVIEHVKLFQSGMLHQPGVGEGSMSTTIRTYKGSVNIRNYYVPTGFYYYSTLYDPTTTHLFWSQQKALNDAGLKTVTMKIKASYSFHHPDVYPMNSWSGEASVLY
jgi:hypothetical protein